MKDYAQAKKSYYNHLEIFMIELFIFYDLKRGKYYLNHVFYHLLPIIYINSAFLVPHSVVNYFI